MMDKEYVKSIISDIQDSLRKENKVPDYALIESVKHSVIEDLMNTLRERCTRMASWSTTRHLTRMVSV